MFSQKLHRIMPIILCAALIFNAVPLNASAAEIYIENENFSKTFSFDASQEKTLSAAEADILIEINQEDAKAENKPESVSETAETPENKADLENMFDKRETDEEKNKTDLENKSETEIREENKTVIENNSENMSEDEEENKKDAEAGAQTSDELQTESVESESVSDTETESELEAETESESAPGLQPHIDEFNLIAASKPLMALLYRANAYSVRKEPSNGSKIIASIDSGHTLYIKSVEFIGDDIWYQVQFALSGNEYAGYVEEYYLAYSDEDWINWKNDGCIIAPYALNSAPDFSDVQSFPAHYQDKLKALKQQHQNWIFVPMNTKLDFNTVVTKEMGDKSLIQNIKANADKGWVGELYGGGWYFAEKSAVEHYVNPLNFLSESYIFQFEQLTFNGSYHTVAAIQNFLNNTFMKGTLPDDAKKSYAQAFFEIGKSRSLSPIHLASRVYQEQGKGTSPLISGKYSGYEGYYNYFNVGASGKTDEEVFRTGLTHAKSKGWNTHYKSLAGGAAVIGNNYILKGQDTPYLQKFNVDGSYNALYTHQYMQNIQAPASEAQSTKKMYANAGSLDSAFVFKIPVFINMPGEQPEERHLESITLDKASLILQTPDALTGDSYFDAKDSLTVSFNPSDTTDEITVEWSFSNQDVVDKSDSDDPKKVIIRALKGGKATVTATATAKTAKGEIIKETTAQCQIEVLAPPAPSVEKCAVTFMKKDNTSVLQQMDIPYKGTIAAENLPKLSGNDDELFIGWFTGEGGTGAFIDETAIFSEESVTLYPYFEKQGRGFYVLPVGDQTYTGSAIKPDVQVFDSTPDADGKNSLIKLEKNKDYTISYKNNKNANTPESGKPAVVITGKGNYSGTQYAYFNITQKSLDDSDISIENITAAYSAKPQKPAPAVYHSGRKLVPNRDFTLSYTDISLNEQVDSCIRPGTYIMTVEGNSNYSGTLTAYLKITNDIFMSKASVAKIPDQQYDKNLVNSKKGMIPESLTVTYKGQTLEEGKDYIVSYVNHFNVGTATASITAKGASGFAGTKKVTYKITGMPINRAFAENIDSKPYTGDEKDVLQKNAKLSINGEALRENTDYTVSYQNTEKAGTAAIIFKGINGYTGQLKKTYKITPLEIDADDAPITLAYSTQDAPDALNPITSLSEITSPYMKGITCPDVQLYLNGAPLVKGKDYTIKYANNKQVTADGLDESKLPTITITGKGSFKGSIKGTWKITESGLDEDSGKVKLVLKDAVYKNAPNKYKAAITLIDANGAKLSAGKDYDKNIAFTYTEDTIVTNASGESIKRSKGDEIGSADIPAAGTKIKAAVTGKGAYPGEISGIYRIVSNDIAKAKASVKAKAYQNTGPVTLTPEDITIAINDKELVYGKDYMIDAATYANNTKKGKASVVLKGIGENYSGEKKINFTIASKAILWWK